jgi:hypothetical protein
VVAVVAHIIQVQVAMAAQAHLVHTALHQLVTAQIDKINIQAVLADQDQVAI